MYDLRKSETNMYFDPNIPFDLPELPPKTEIRDSDYTSLLVAASKELGELNGNLAAMPNPMLMFSPAIIKESLESSSIENINTTLEDVLQNQLFPEQERRQPDKEVLRYRDAVYWAFDNLKNIPVSSRMITGIHQKLLPEVTSGYRKTQNKIANSETGKVLYTPPEANYIPGLISNWEKYVNEASNIHPLIRNIIAHYQFEAVHPFVDGNGRTGRILMVLMLVQDEILGLPVLYISDYINKNRQEYYKLLRNVSKKNDWESLITFMLKGFVRQAKETKQAFFSIMAYYNEFSEILKAKNKKIFSIELVNQLFTYPIITATELSRNLDIHYTTAGRHLNSLVKAGMLKEKRSGKYNLFINHRLFEVFHGRFHD